MNTAGGAGGGAGGGPAEDKDGTTEDRLLGGRVLLRQPRRGLRAGLDAVLLAAVLARGEGRPLDYGDLLKGFASEYKKLGRHVPAELRETT